MADSVTEAVAVAPAGEPGEVSAIGKKDVRVKRPQENNIHIGAPTPAVLPRDVLAFLEVAMPGTVPADAAGGSPVVTVVKDTNESTSTAKITKEPTHTPPPPVVETQVTQKHTSEPQEAAVHIKEPVTKPGISSVGLSPEVLSFLDLTLSGVAEPEIPEEASQAAPVTPDSREPHDVTTSYTVRDRVSTQAPSSTSVEQKQIADEVVVQDIAEEAATAVDVTDKVAPAVQVAKTEVRKAEVVAEVVQEDVATVSEVAVEEVNTAQEVETVPKAEEIIKVAPAAQLVSTSSSAVQVAKTVCSQVVADPIIQEEDVVSEVAVEQVSTAQEDTHQEAAVETVSKAKEVVHAEKEAPKAEDEDIAPAKATEPEKKPPVVEEPAAVATEPATVATEPAAVATEPAAVATEPAAVATEPAAVATEPVAVATEPVAEVKEPAKEEAVTETGEPEKILEVAEEAAPAADEDKEKKPTVAAKTEWTEEQVKEWSQEGYVPMVNNMFLPSTMRVLPSPLFYIGVGVLTALVFYLTESPIMALMTLVFILVLILLARLFYLYRLHVWCAEESAGQKKSE
ncbi:neurofilament heavy polypeptide-like isoform X3 [Branchiostoma lanceolatum]|uniref:neurofilament heavy polypeptide-like isoform X3 n=1 Tax=Branchiostoma lanceolatum TaxID=7740 RepID=UPI0034567F2F